MPQAMMKSEEEGGVAPYLFPQGLAGFTSAHEFGFVYEGKGQLICMQCLDQMEAAFILTQWDAERLGEVPELSQEQLACLNLTREQLNSGEDVMWMLVLNPFADKQWVTANLRAPIILNTEDRLGLQMIRYDTTLELRYPWMPQPSQPKLAAVKS